MKMNVIFNLLENSVANVLKTGYKMIFESVTFSVSLSELENIGEYKKMHDDYNEKYMKYYSLAKQDQVSADKFFDENLLHHPLMTFMDKTGEINMANRNASEIMTLMGINRSTSSVDSYGGDEIFQSGQDYSDGTMPVYEFKQAVNQLKELQNFGVRETTKDGNMISFGLSKNQISNYIKQFEKMIDFAETYGITTIQWA
jgi:hypothetical protein